jgi:hypothetical protein
MGTKYVNCEQRINISRFKIELGIITVCLQDELSYLHYFSGFKHR